MPMRIIFIIVVFIPALCNCWINLNNNNRFKFPANFIKNSRDITEISSFSNACLHNQNIPQKSFQNEKLVKSLIYVVSLLSAVFFMSPKNPSYAQSLGTKVEIGQYVKCGDIDLEQLTKEGAGGGTYILNVYVYVFECVCKDVRVYICICIFIFMHISTCIHVKGVLYFQQ
jgi:hypothetical protein